MISGVVCKECLGEIPYVRDRKTSTRFCSEKCRYKARDRARYAADPEGQRARSRAYYRANREQVLAKAAVRRGVAWPPPRTSCAECEAPLEGGQRVVCSRRCKDSRYARLHPEQVAEKQRRKRARRRARRDLVTESEQGRS